MPLNGEKDQMEKRTETSGLIMPNSIYTLSVPAEYGASRIDKFITAQFPLYSRTFFQHLMSNQMVMLNGQPVNKPSISIKPHDIVEISFGQKKEREVIVTEVNKMGIEIVHTHEHFFIVYKPAGVLMHPTQGNNMSPTLMDWLLTNHEELASVGPVDRPGIVHRLDKDTSGLIVVPRTNYAHTIFGALFKNRQIQKTYCAVVHGIPPEQGTIDYAIGRHPIQRKKMTAFPPSSYVSQSPGQLQRQIPPSTVRSATTHFTRDQVFEDAALIWAKPVTGRTHQIRVHLAALGHPLIGDELYGKESSLISRQALHSFSISFEFEGTSYSFTREVPDDFAKLVAHLKQQNDENFLAFLSKDE